MSTKTSHKTRRAIAEALLSKYERLDFVGIRERKVISRNPDGKTYTVRTMRPLVPMIWVDATRDDAIDELLDILNE